MYCPVCFQNTLKLRSSGVVKLAFNGKSRNNSLFTYNLQKETPEQLLAKLKEKIVDWMSFYSEFVNKDPIKTFEVFSADFLCTNSCKIDLSRMKVSVIGLIYTQDEVKRLLHGEAKKYDIPIEVSFK